MEDVVQSSNIFYNCKTCKFETTPSPLFETIEEPILVIETLHSCFAHAVIDGCFPFFWVLQEILKETSAKHARIFILKNKFLSYPKENLPLLDDSRNAYKGAYKDLLELLSPFPPIFQHALESDLFCKRVYFYPKDDKWQRSPWNCQEYYPDRKIPKQSVRFSDEVIYTQLKQFRNHVLQTYSPQAGQTNDWIILDRKYRRKFDQEKLNKLVEVSKQASGNFKGVFVLQDMSFREQVQLFANSRVCMFRHGSALAHLLWIPHNSIVVEFEGGNDGVISPMVVQRLCLLTESTHLRLEYDTYNPTEVIERICKIRDSTTISRDLGNEY